MALRKFTPDPDLFDPNDDQSWIGTWEHDDGSPPLYGQGDPEMGRELLASNEAGATPETGAPELPSWGGPLNDQEAERLDAGTPRQPNAPEPALQPPAQPAPAQPSAPVDSWESAVPTQVANALKQHATDAGLNPAAVASVIQKESGWNPSIQSQGDAGQDAHGGLIQFSRNLWPGVAKAAGRPDVTWDQMMGMSAEEQVPFVVAYYKGKGLTPESGEGDYRLATYKPAHLDKDDSYVLDDSASTKGIKATPQNARLDANQDGIINSYEQNQSLDLDKDGKITTHEVRGGPRGAGARVPPGALPGAQPPQPGGLPPTMNGMPAAQTTVNGVPLTPDQIQQQQAGVGQRYAAAVGMQQQAEQVRQQGRTEVLAQWQDHYSREQTDANTRLQNEQRAAQEAQEHVDREVNAPIQKVDPKRYLKDMSTGERVVGAIAVLLSGIGQGILGSVGIQTQNLALAAINKGIDDDIASQKDALDRGESQKNSRIAFWTKKLGNAESGVNAARAEAKQAAGGLMQARAMGMADNAEGQAKMLEYAGQMFAQGQAEVQAISDRERARLQTVYATPKPPAGENPIEAALKSTQAAKALRQEMELSGMKPEEVKAALAARGLPYLAGPTVSQNQHDTDQKRADEKHAADQKRLDGQLDNKERQAEAAHATVTHFGTTTPLKRNMETNQWEVPKDAPSVGWKLSGRTERNAARSAAIEAFGRLQSDGVISPSEEVRFGEMIGSSTATLEEMAASLNAIERIIQSRRNPTRATGAPDNWK